MGVGSGPHAVWESAGFAPDFFRCMFKSVDFGAF